MTACDICIDPLLKTDMFRSTIENVSEAMLGTEEMEAILASGCDGYLDPDMLAALQQVFSTHQLISPLDCLQKSERDRCNLALYLLPKSMVDLSIQDWLTDQDWISGSNAQTILIILHAQSIWDIPSLIVSLNAGLLIRLGIHADLSECVFKAIWRDMAADLRGVDVPLFTVIDPDAEDITQVHVMHIDREEVPPVIFFDRNLKLTTNVSKVRSALVEQRIKKTEGIRQELIKEEEAKEKAESSVETAIKTQKPKKAKASDLADAKLRANKAAAYKLIQKKDEEQKRQKRREDKKAKETAAKVAATYDDEDDSDTREKAAERAKRELLMEEENKEKEEKEREKKAAKRQAQRERRAAEKELVRRQEEKEKEAEEDVKRQKREQAAAERQRRQEFERLRKEEVREREAVVVLEVDTRDKQINSFNGALRKREADRRKLIEYFIKDEKSKRTEQSKSESKERNRLEDFKYVIPFVNYHTRTHYSRKRLLKKKKKTGKN